MHSTDYDILRFCRGFFHQLCQIPNSNTHDGWYMSTSLKHVFFVGELTFYLVYLTGLGQFYECTDLTCTDLRGFSFIYMMNFIKRLILTLMTSSMPRTHQNTSFLSENPPSISYTSPDFRSIFRRHRHHMYRLRGFSLVNFVRHLILTYLTIGSC